MTDKCVACGEVAEGKPLYKKLGSSDCQVEVFTALLEMELLSLPPEEKNNHYICWDCDETIAEEYLTFLKTEAKKKAVEAKRKQQDEARKIKLQKKLKLAFKKVRDDELKASGVLPPVSKYKMKEKQREENKYHASFCLLCKCSFETSKARGYQRFTLQKMVDDECDIADVLQKLGLSLNIMPEQKRKRFVCCQCYNKMRRNYKAISRGEMDWNSPEIALPTPVVGQQTGDQSVEVFKRRPTTEEHAAEIAKLIPPSLASLYKVVTEEEGAKTPKVKRKSPKAAPKKRRRKSEGRRRVDASPSSSSSSSSSNDSSSSSSNSSPNSSSDEEYKPESDLKVTPLRKGAGLLLGRKEDKPCSRKAMPRSKKKALQALNNGTLETSPPSEGPRTPTIRTLLPKGANEFGSCDSDVATPVSITSGDAEIVDFGICNLCGLGYNSRPKDFWYTLNHLMPNVMGVTVSNALKILDSDLADVSPSVREKELVCKPCFSRVCKGFRSQILQRIAEKKGIDVNKLELSKIKVKMMGSLIEPTKANGDEEKKDGELKLNGAFNNNNNTIETEAKNERVIKINSNLPLSTLKRNAHHSDTKVIKLNDGGESAAARAESDTQESLPSTILEQETHKSLESTSLGKKESLKANTSSQAEAQKSVVAKKSTHSYRNGHVFKFKKSSRSSNKTRSVIKEDLELISLINESQHLRYKGKVVLLNSVTVNVANLKGILSRSTILNREPVRLELFKDIYQFSNFRRNLKHKSVGNECCILCQKRGLGVHKTTRWLEDPVAPPNLMVPLRWAKLSIGSPPPDSKVNLATEDGKVCGSCHKSLKDSFRKFVGSRVATSHGLSSERVVLDKYKVSFDSIAMIIVADPLEASPAKETKKSKPHDASKDIKKLNDSNDLINKEDGSSKAKDGISLADPSPRKQDSAKSNEAINAPDAQPLSDEKTNPTISTENPEGQTKSQIVEHNPSEKENSLQATKNGDQSLSTEEQCKAEENNQISRVDEDEPRDNVSLDLALSDSEEEEETTQSDPEVPSEKCEAAPEVPSEKSEAAPEVSSEKSEAAPEVPSEKSEAAPEVPSEKSEAAPEVPSEKSEAAPEVPSEKSEAAPEVPSEKSEAAPEVPSEKSEAAPEVPSENSKTAPEFPSEKSEAAPEIPSEKSKTAPEVPSEKSEGAPEGNSKKDNGRIPPPPIRNQEVKDKDSCREMDSGVVVLGDLKSISIQKDELNILSSDVMEEGTTSTGKDSVNKSDTIVTEGGNKSGGQVNSPSSSGSKPSSEADNPSSSGSKPSSEADNPSSSGSEPSSEADNPSSSGSEPSSEADNPSSSGSKPSSEADNPSSSGSKPSSEADNPSSSGDKPGCQTKDLSSSSDQSSEHMNAEGGDLETKQAANSNSEAAHVKSKHDPENSPTLTQKNPRPVSPDDSSSICSVDNPMSVSSLNDFPPSGSEEVDASLPVCLSKASLSTAISNDSSLVNLSNASDSVNPSNDAPPTTIESNPTTPINPRSRSPSIVSVNEDPLALPSPCGSPSKDSSADELDSPTATGILPEKSAKESFSIKEGKKRQDQPIILIDDESNADINLSKDFESHIPPRDSDSGEAISLKKRKKDEDPGQTKCPKISENSQAKALSNSPLCPSKESSRPQFAKKSTSPRKSADFLSKLARSKSLSLKRKATSEASVSSEEDAVPSLSLFPDDGCMYKSNEEENTFDEDTVAPFAQRKKFKGKSDSALGSKKESMQSCLEDVWQTLQSISLDDLINREIDDPLKLSQYNVGFLLALNDLRVHLGASLEDLLVWLKKLLPIGHREKGLEPSMDKFSTYLFSFTNRPEELDSKFLRQTLPEELFFCTKPSRPEQSTAGEPSATCFIEDVMDESCEPKASRRWEDFLAPVNMDNLLEGKVCRVSWNDFNNGLLYALWKMNKLIRGDEKNFSKWLSLTSTTVMRDKDYSAMMKAAVAIDNHLKNYPEEIGRLVAPIVIRPNMPNAPLVKDQPKGDGRKGSGCPEIAIQSYKEGEDIIVEKELLVSHPKSQGSETPLSTPVFITPANSTSKIAQKKTARVMPQPPTESSEGKNDPNTLPDIVEICNDDPSASGRSRVVSGKESDLDPVQSVNKSSGLVAKGSRTNVFVNSNGVEGSSGQPSSPSVNSVNSNFSKSNKVLIDSNSYVPLNSSATLSNLSKAPVTSPSTVNMISQNSNFSMIPTHPFTSEAQNYSLVSTASANQVQNMSQIPAPRMSFQSPFSPAVSSQGLPVIPILSTGGFMTMMPLSMRMPNMVSSQSSIPVQHPSLTPKGFKGPVASLVRMSPVKSSNDDQQLASKVNNLERQLQAIQKQNSQLLEMNQKLLEKTLQDNVKEIRESEIRVSSSSGAVNSSNSSSAAVTSISPELRQPPSLSYQGKSKPSLAPRKRGKKDAGIKKPKPSFDDALNYNYKK